MITLNTFVDELKRIIPEYMFLVVDYLSTGRRLADEVNPINLLSVSIDELNDKEKYELISKIKQNTESLSLALKELSSYKVAS